MIRAMRENDRSFDGCFFVGVQSTGIYCLPSCRARLPLLKNVVFYATREEAIAAGLRGCKRCRAESFPDVLPGWLQRLLAYMREHRDQRLTETALREMAGVDTSTVRRYFREHLHTTALGFHRNLRLDRARELLKSGENYLAAGYACGWESASGFRDAYRRRFGRPPGRK